MKRLVFLLAFLFLFGCASGTTIRTIPDGARVKSQDGALLGITPYYHWDRLESDSVTSFTLELEGYAPKIATIKKDCLYVHRFFAPPVLALPWLYGYQVEYLFELNK